MKKFMPEGWLIGTPENRAVLESQATLKSAYEAGQIVEARALLCDNDHNLHVDLGCMQGIIRREDGAVGIDDGSVRDIALISRVNKPVAFYVTGFEKDEYGREIAVLSRKAVQIDCANNYISNLIPGDIIDARVTHLEKFGAFADIGAGISALLPIDAISVSRIPHPSERFKERDDIKAVVKSIDDFGRITLTHKELLGTWEQNAANFKAGETVPGIIRSIEKYGVFVELTPNLAGLAEPKERVKPGQRASVYIKSLIPERMKIKLIIVDAFEDESVPGELTYFIDSDYLERWKYSPDCCSRIIETIF